MLLEQRITPAWALEQAIVSFIVGALLFGALTIPTLMLETDATEDILLAIAAGFIVFWLLMLVYAWRRIVTSEYVVTDEAVYTRRGRLLLSVGVATLDRVTDQHVHTGVIGRLFGYSRLVVKTAGGELALVGVRDAYEIRGIVHEARQRLLARLLREAGRSEAATPIQRAALTIQCPNCEQAFDVTGTPPLDVRCPKCQATGTLFPEALA